MSTRARADEASLPSPRKGTLTCCHCARADLQVLAEAAKVFVLVADDRKMSSVLGTAWKQGVPIEVAMFAWATVVRSLERMGCKSAVCRLARARASS